MASFDLTANINAQLNTGNIRAIANQLRNQLSVTANVNVRLAANTAQNIRGLTSGLSVLNRSLAAVGTNASTAQTGINNLVASLRQLNQALGQNANQQALQNIGQQAQQAGSQMEHFGRQAGLALRRFAGFRIASGIASAFFGVITQGTRQAIAFQQEMVRISQVSGRSLQSLKSLSNEITRLSTKFGTSSKELVDISLTLAQAGLSANETQKSLEALAKTTLAPTFTDISETAEGAIAIMAQFGISANKLETALSSINAVSAQFAVESDDIIAAVKRSGGIFAATSKGVSEGTDALNEFIAVFTSVRATTRESAETIATGLRTIFTRIQRPTTIAFLKEMGVNLVDLQGKFVGPFESITRISGALKDLDARDPQFARLVEELGGFRQVGKVIPLLTEQETRLKALAVAQKGVNSLNEDSESGQQALAVQIAKVREELAKLFIEVSQTDTFKALVDTTLGLASAAIKLATAIKPLIPLLAAFAAYRGAIAVGQFGRGLLGRGGIRFHSGGYVGRQRFDEGGDIRPSGLVPGGKGVRDDVPATLQTGEFVIRRRAVDAIGKQNLDKINRTGRANFAVGGLVNQTRVGAALLQPLNFASEGPITVTQDQVPSLPNKTQTFQLIREALDNKDSKEVTNKITEGAVSGLQNGAKALAGTNIMPGTATNILNRTNFSGILGSLFEGVLSAINFGDKFDSGQDGNRRFDFVGGFNSVLGQKFQRLRGIKYIDAKVNDTAGSIANLKDKVIGQLNNEHSPGQRVPRPRQAPKPLTEKQQIDKERRAAKSLARRQNLGNTIGLATGGEVPALLTRGEYVINRRAAKSLGGGVLNQLNNADRVKRNRGGFIGRQRLAPGGFAGRLLDDLTGLFGDIGTDPRRRSQRAATLRREARRRATEALRNNQGTIATAGFFGGSLLGGTAGGAIGGAATGGLIGGQLGSVFGPAGGAIGGIGGAVAGGVLGGANAFLDSKTAKGIEEASKIVSKALEEVEAGMEQYEKFGNIQAVKQSFSNVNAGIAKVAQSRIEQEDGFTGGFSAGRVGLLTAVRDVFTAGPDARLARPETTIRASSVQEVERNRNRVNRTIGKDIQQQFAPAGEAVQRIFEDQVKQGKSFTDILKGLTTDQKTALALNNAGAGELSAIGTAASDPAQLEAVVNAQLRSSVFLRETLVERIALEKKVAEAQENSNNQLDEFFNNLEDITAAIERAGDAGSGFASRNAALTGGGVVTSQRNNPFANLRGFKNDPRAVAQAAQQSIRSLGGGAGSGGFAKELLNAATSANDLQTRLPKLLNDIVFEEGTDEEGNRVAQGNQIEQVIRDNFKNVPSVIIEKLVNDIKNETQGVNPQGVGLRQFAAENARGIAGQVNKGVPEAFKREIDVRNKATAEYEAAVNTWIGLQQTANEQFDNTVARSIENQNQIKSLDKTLSFEDLTSGFTTRQSALAKRGGATGSDLDSVVNRLGQLDAQRRGLTNQAVLNQQQGATPEDIQRLTDLQGVNNLQIQTVEEVLRQIAGNTQISAAATQKLAEIENLKKTSQQLAEEFVTASPGQRREFNRSIQLAEAGRGGAQFTGRLASEAFQGERRLTGLAGEDQEEADRRIRRQLATRGDVDNLFGRGGRTAQNALVLSPEEQRLRGVLGANAATQAQAGSVLGGRDQGRTNEFLDNSRQQLQAVTDSLSQILKDYSDILASAPKTITVGGTVTVEARITGAEAFAATSREMVKLVDSRIQQALRNNIDATARIENKQNA